MQRLKVLGERKTFGDKAEGAALFGRDIVSTRSLMNGRSASTWRDCGTAFKVERG
ncbi:MAG: hypothetical protein JSS54_02775 [Proteobacteria bacterium]|nr:hypothetical protein [Pseudomonadota bacterium]